MPVSIKFALPLAALFFGLLLVPRAALAQVANCPVEPKSNVPIADGEVFIGTNCTLKTSGDVDSFVFNANNGDTYQLALAINGAAPTNICLTLYSPSAVQIFSGCTTVGYVGGLPSVATDQKLTATGTYTMVITEISTATINYAVSLERLYPFPSNAKQITLATVYAGDIAELTDSNAFKFGVVTTGTYEVSASLSGTVTNNICMTVYSPNGTLVVPSSGTNPGCTTVGYVGGSPTVQIDFTPTQAGTNMAFLQVDGNDGTATYNLEVSCLVGTCTQPPPPPCTLSDAASYNATTSTLTMKFTVGNTAADTWNAWLTYQNTMKKLFTVAQPITNPPVVITKTASLPKEGKVGVLSTLTNSTKGIACSSWVQVSTGTP